MVSSLSYSFCSKFATSESSIVSRYHFVPAYTIAACLWKEIGLFSFCLRSSTNLLPLASFACVDLSKSDQNLANVSNSLKAARSSLRVPDTFLTIPVCADHPTRDTESPTLMAGLIPALNKSDSR